MLIEPKPGMMVSYHVGDHWPAMIVKVHDSRRVDVKVFTSDNIFTAHSALLRQPEDAEPKEPHVDFGDRKASEEIDDVVEKLAEEIEEIKALVEQRFANLFGR